MHLLRLIALSLGIAGVGIASFATPQARTDPPSTNVIQVTLVAERESIAPGHESWVGIRFQLAKGWHIYWINPGDSGDPPRVQWRLPPGFKAGPLQWPHPERLVTKYAVDYGYADEVMLLAPIRAPAKLAARNQVEFAATVKWVVCREVCLPGKTEVALSLPVTPRAASQPAGSFEDARKRVPERAPARWRARALAEQNEFVLAIEAGEPITSAVFFPLQPRQIENTAEQTASAQPRGIELRLRKSEQLLRPIARLQGVLVLPSGKSYLIDAPVTVAGNTTPTEQKSRKKS